MESFSSWSNSRLTRMVLESTSDVALRSCPEWQPVMDTLERPDLLGQRLTVLGMSLRLVGSG
jgi:hypothetical protein